MAPLASVEHQGPIVGIDLGTSNTAVAVADTAGAPVRILPIEQWTAGDQLESQPLLPSVLYAPLAGEIAGSQSQVEGWALGEYARRRARELPARAIVSAKSWLCHAGVDRQAPILPWRSSDAVDDVPRISPVSASAYLLRQVHAQLERELGPDLARAKTVLTVPASFDPFARELTLRAAHQAGFHPQLVEEPHAAFQAAISDLGEVGVGAWMQGAAQRLVLVVDVGGGTTDLALVRLSRTGSDIRSTRVAVGRHLLLGGDNVDGALAQLVATRLGERPAGVELAELLLRVRDAKEVLLGPGAPEVHPVTWARRGAALVGATRRAELSRQEVEHLVFDGFFPPIGEPAPAARTGLLGMGLPFERDPAISRHVAAFVERHRAEQGAPDAILCNGGMFRSPAVVARLVGELSRWLGSELSVLPNTDPDLAVARGAACYAQAVLGRGIALESRSAFAYYVGVSGGDAPAAVCIVPRGAADAVAFRTPGRMGLLVGEPSRFELFASEVFNHTPGEVVRPIPPELQQLPALSTTVAPDAQTPAGSRQPVQLEAAVSAVGVLQVSALASAGARYELTFELHQPATATARVAAENSVPPSAVDPVLAEALVRVERVFGKGRVDVAEREVKDLLRELERLLGPRREWPLPRLRRLFDVLAADVRARRRSAEHERLFFLLAGFCLRPGFGDAADPARVARLAPLFKEGLQFAEERRSWDAFFIAFRRIAPGFSAADQLQIRDRLDPFIAPEEAKLKRPKGFRPQAEEELLSLSVWLERAGAARRGELGQWLLERTWTSRNPLYWEWIGQVGARVPVYAEAANAVDARTAEHWLRQLFSENWQTLAPAGRAAWQLSRVTGDPRRDLPLGVRREVAARLGAIGAAESWSASVLDFVATESSERAAAFGDELPPGLAFLTDD